MNFETEMQERQDLLEIRATLNLLIVELDYTTSDLAKVIRRPDNVTFEKVMRMIARRKGYNIKLTKRV